MKAKYATNGTGPGRMVLFWCPGCDRAHQVLVETDTGWGFNGDLEAPTFTPSYKVTGVQWKPEYGFHMPTHHVEPGKQTICHSWINDGRIEFCGDSTHHLVGQTVDLPEWPNP